MYFNKILQRTDLKKCSRELMHLSKASVSTRTFGRNDAKQDEFFNYPRKIFSGIQPTGRLHLGNYLGAVQKWIALQNSQEDVTFCIVDMHSITVPQNPPELRENIFEMAATMFACGLEPENSNIFVQSSVQEHTELGWILNCLCTMARLGHLPQYKEKSRTIKDVPLGLYVYPILQAADIMLHKATHIPVGEDQIQHIQLTQHLSRVFNAKYGITFPVCQAMIENQDAARIRSLRNPSKKMSKSDLDAKSTINIRDPPELILEKIKKAVTDFTSDVSYEPHTRPGVSNLVVIHSLVTNTPIEKVVEEAKTIDTGRYKLRVAEAVIEHLKPIRRRIDDHLMRKNDLINILELGAAKARLVTEQNIVEIKQKMGLGTFTNIPLATNVHEEPEETSTKPKKEEEKKPPTDSDIPVVPKQKIRLEHRRIGQAQYKSKSTFKLNDDTILSPIIKKA